MNAKVRTCLWFNSEAEAAVEFYVALIPGSAIERVFRPEPGAAAVTVDFTLGGSHYQALNGGPRFPHSEAASLVVMTEDQAETDRLWSALTADGGSESRCGWLKDRYGLSWQIVPAVLPRLLSDPDSAAAARAMQAMMGMRKIDIAMIEAAHRGP